MEGYQEIISVIALTMGASWASGINLYAALLVLGIGGATGQVELPENLALLQSPLVIGVAGCMYCMEFVADKVPGVDTGWDALQTFVRVPAGAMLAAGAVGDVGPAMEVAVGIVGGGMAMTSHATKAGSRVVINTSPEPVSNWTASIVEDLAVFGGLWVALNHPIFFIILLILFVMLAIWLLPKILRGIKVVACTIGGWLGLVKPAESDSSDERQKLRDLHDSGTLTDDEYTQAEKRLLDPEKEEINPDV